LGHKTFPKVEPEAIWLDYVRLSALKSTFGKGTAKSYYTERHGEITEFHREIFRASRCVSVKSLGNSVFFFDSGSSGLGWSCAFGVVMKINIHPISDKWHRRIRAIEAMLVVALIGPMIGFLLSAFGLVLAPPWTFLTSLIYLPIACLGLPVGIMAVVRGWMRGWGLVVALIVAGLVAPFYLALLAPWLPTGMTNCQPMASSWPQVRYTCVSTSSDDSNYHYEFILEGWPGWPVMRLVDSKP
jgi:hypothetical protein